MTSKNQKKIQRLFIANRGEICRRIATTAHRLGIETVAVCDRQAPPSFLLGVVTHFVKVPEESPALYLSGEKMVALAKESGCDALHPGFGFLSENAGFAAACEAAGLIWVGPKPSAIEAMASKATAREIAEKSGVPCIKGLNGFPVPKDINGDFSVLENFAAQTGYPLLLKAALGGGGKGMRLVHEKSQLREAALRASSEAVNSFGDGRLICERYLGAPRHVEVQILADKHGNAFAIGDRDCSVQRRHQKVIEEAPAPELKPETREAMQAAAVRLSKGVAYDNAGTVEFLVDWTEDAAKGGRQDFFFLEMNTRLQVEHPVTEEVFGLDLVEWQLRIAQGEVLPTAFKALPPRGHSLEIRLYAEDVANDYFPSPGPIAAFVPAQGPGIRWEVGIDPVDAVTGRFDPMVAKLVVTGSDRLQAMARLADALERTVFAGPSANIDLLIELTRRSKFATQPVTTHYLTQNLPEFLTQIQKRYEALTPMAQSSLALIEKALATAGEAPSADAAGANVAALTAQAFGLNSFAAASSSQRGEGESSAGVYFSLNGGWQVAGTGSPNGAGDMGALQSRIASGLLRHPDGKTEGFWYAAMKTSVATDIWLKLQACQFHETRSARRSSAAGSGHARGGHESDELLAPVPGKVIAIKIEAGSEVKSKQAVFILESMKMEFEVKAPKSGKIGVLKVKIGDQVTAGQLLATWA